MICLRVVFALVLALGSASAANIAFDFDFESAPNPGGGLAWTSGGLTATFTSPEVFFVVPSPFQTLTGNVLASASGGPTSLDISFDQDISSVMLSFALFESPLTLEAYADLAPVGSTTATGTVEPDGFLEGTISFAGGPFNRIVLSSASDFAIDNVTPIPEPTPMLLISMGLATVGFVRWRPAYSPVQPALGRRKRRRLRP